MSFLISLAAALAVAIALVLGSRLWFGKIMKRRHAEQIGIEALAARSFRDAQALIVEALGREGLTAQAELGGPQLSPQGERVLRRGDSTVLLVYKHGMGYRIGAPALRDAEKRRQEADIDEVVIATLGSVDAEAQAQAARMRITCRDGAAVWAMVGSALDAGTRTAVDAEAEQRIDGPRRLSTIGAAVLGFAIVFWGADLDQYLVGFATGTPAETATPATSATVAAVAAQAPGPSEAAGAPAPAAIPAAASASAPPVATATPVIAQQDAAATDAIAQETPAERRRVELAKAIGLLAEVDRASWSSSSTLVLSVNRRATIEQAQQRTCELSAEYPELRDVRLQFEAGGGSDIRWRRCA
jgi:hypothetical protein